MKNIKPESLNIEFEKMALVTAKIKDTAKQMKLTLEVK